MNMLYKHSLTLLAALCLTTNILVANSAENDLPEEEVVIQDYTTRDPFYPIDYSSYAIASIGYKGNSITLSDGSLWFVRPWDQHYVDSWFDFYDGNPTTIYVSTNNDLFKDTNYPYKIINKQTGKSIYCNISSLAPITNCLWIYRIDYATGRVEVAHANGYNVFYLADGDFSNYLNWQPGDIVFYGRNTRWDSYSFPYLIINFTAENSARCDL